MKFQAADEEAGREFFEISSVVSRAFVQLAAVEETGESGQNDSHMHTERATRTMREIIAEQATLDAAHPQRPSAREDALRILARSEKLI